MSYDLLTAFALFAFVSSITPGPNNLMLMASGANFGFVRTVPHMLGIGIGFTVMICLVGAGLAQVFELWPISYTVLKVLSTAYLVWLAWKIATAAGISGAKEGDAPMTFMQAALFQWVNPKAWAMAMTAVTVYMPDRSVMTLLTIAAVFGAINLPSVSSWTVLGQEIARFLTNRHRLRAFNWTMAALLVASLYPLFMT